MLVIIIIRVLTENASRPEAEKLHVVVSISPQAIVSVAKKYLLSTDDCVGKLAGMYS